MAGHHRAIVLVHEPTPERRSAWEFSDPTLIHVDSRLAVLRLRPNANDRYSTAANVFARTPLLEASALRRVLGVAASVELPEGTSIAYRLNDGAADLWWNGAAWAAAGAGEWNTLADVYSNLGTFPVTTRELRVVINLATTDDTATPLVRDVTVAYEVDVPSWDEEFIHRTLVRALRSNVAPVADLSVKWAGGDSLAFGPVEAAMEESIGAKVREIVGAYNASADADLRSDVFAAYDVGTKTVTLSAAQPAGDVVVLRAEYEPQVAVSTHQDYDEIPRLPAIVLSQVGRAFEGEDVLEQGTVHPTTYAAVAVPAPRQYTYTIALRLLAARHLDLLRLADAVDRFARDFPVIQSAATGVEVGIEIVEGFEQTPGSRSDRLHEGRMTLTMRAAEHWTRGAQAGMFGVARIQLAGDLTATIE